MKILITPTRKKQNSKEHAFTKFSGVPSPKIQSGTAQIKCLQFSMQLITTLRCISQFSPSNIKLKDLFENPSKGPAEFPPNSLIFFLFPVFWKHFQSQWIFVVAETVYLLSHTGDGHHDLHLFITLLILYKASLYLSCLNVSNSLCCISRIRLFPVLDSSAACI